MSESTSQSASPSTHRKPRADAQRNRELILKVAQEAFARQGANVTLEDIVRLSGLGVGTLYRHFPTRDALIEAVYLSDKVVVFSKRPARVAKEISIALSYPRNHRVRFTAAFTAAERIASEALGVIAPAPEEVAAP